MDSAIGSPLAQRYENLLRRAFPELTLLAEDQLFPPLASDTPEMVWQSRWFAGDFGREFHTREGLPVRIVQFGHWNHGPGPDFQECAVELNGVVHRGCIELDPEEGDWERHGHAQNPAYDDVVLHVFLRKAREQFFTRTSTHRQVPQVQLAWQELATVVDHPQPAAKPGRCQRLHLQGWSESRVNLLLQSAARFRLERKASRWQRLARLHGPDEAHFQFLAECLGYRRNKLPMTILAQQFPLKTLRKHPEQAEAWLFGAAGFLDDVRFEESDPPTRAYLRRLWSSWWRHRAAWKESPHGRDFPWNFAATRPTNHPQRRVAALATLAQQWHQVAPFLAPDGFVEKSLVKALQALSHEYWDHHYTLTASPVVASLAILGKTRIVEMLANAIYPALVAQREDLWSQYTNLRAQLGNEKTRLAALRLFGATQAAEAFHKRVYQQQGLLQIFEDFCLTDASDCEGCPFPEQLVAEF
jgi:hypothetical protein